MLALMTARETLGARVRERRLALGLSQREAATDAGVSDQTWVNVEQGRKVSERTLSGVNRALRWEPGSAEAALDGREPTALLVDPNSPVTRAEVDELRRRLDEVIRRLDDRDRHAVDTATDHEAAVDREAKRVAADEAQRRGAERERGQLAVSPRSA